MPRTRTTFMAGHAVTDEMRQKIRASRIGNAYNRGRKHRPESIEQMKIAARNRPSPCTEVREKISRTLTGRKIPVEQRMKYRGRFTGPKNPSWKGGVSKRNKSERQLAMQTTDYRIWRESVFARDNWTCQICGRRGAKLNADHIKSWSEYPELRYDVSNGRALCVECHRETPSYSNRNKPYGLSTHHEGVS